MKTAELLSLLDDEINCPTREVWRALRLAKYQIEDAEKRIKDAHVAGESEGLAYGEASGWEKGMLEAASIANSQRIGDMDGFATKTEIEANILAAIDARKAK